MALEVRRHAFFKSMCPNCGGTISDERLLLKLPCEECLPLTNEELEELVSKYSGGHLRRVVAELLKRRGKLEGYKEILELEEDLNALEEIFEKALGNRMWSAQRTWAKRLLKGKSFAILAPTGVGKTVFGLLSSLFLASKGKKSYVVLPTTLLLSQAIEKVERFKERTGINARVLFYHGKLTNSEKREFTERLEKGDYDILITTSQFLARSFDKLKGRRFDFVFVDDVDALLKSSRNIDRVLQLLGFDEGIIKDAMSLIYLKRGIASRIAKRMGVPEDWRKKAEQLRGRIAEYVKRRRWGVLIVSTATGKVRGDRVKLFRELLGFEVGSRAEFLRNVADIYYLTKGEPLEEALLNVVKTMGKGGLVFVPTDKGVEYAKALLRYLNENGIKAGLVTSEEKGDLERFVAGELDVVIGVAIYYGLLVRGIDLPEVIRYAVFAGVPRFKFSLEVGEPNPIRMLQLLITVRDTLEGELAERCERYIALLRRNVLTLDRASLSRLIESLKGGAEVKGVLSRVRKLVLEVEEFLRDLLGREDVRERLKGSDYVSVIEEEGRMYVLVPDVMTYLQASGRTSRMYAGGISRGASIVVVDDVKLHRGLMRQSKWYNEDVDWKEWREADLARLIGEIDKDRERIRRILKGELEEIRGEPVKTALLVVESPNKARTISNFFGRPSVRRIENYVVYETSTGNYILNVIASGGHVFDLVTKEGFHGVAVSDGAFYPIYDTIKKCPETGEQFTDELDIEEYVKETGRNVLDAKDVLRVIRELAEEMDLVLIGTDPDTEGEKIGWDVAISVAPYTYDIKRIEFHEVTKRAILSALGNLRELDQRLVEAQIVRRIEDRWIGFELSKKLWEVFENRGLSAGRVQTPVLGWIIQRFKEHNESKKTVIFVTLSNGLTVRFFDVKIDVNRGLLKELRGSRCRLSVEEEREVVLNPPPPYTTDEMLKEATRELRLGVDQVMRLAQDLFETGLITYHRTDSTRVSLTGRAVAKDYLTEKYGEGAYVGREWRSEGAHECIRPTRPLNVDKLRELIMEGVLRIARPLTRSHFRLYDLIFRRFMASQMREAKLLYKRYKVTLCGLETRMEGYVKVLEEGFTREYLPFRLMEELEESEYEVKEVRKRKVATVPLYTQADVVKLMKERGIGRPSTYAKIIKTLLDRRYVLETRKGRLVPTKKGMRVYEYLTKHYGSLVSEERTRLVEERMRKIEEGETLYQSVLREFYDEITRSVA